MFRRLKKLFGTGFTVRDLAYRYDEKWFAHCPDCGSKTQLDSVVKRYDGGVPLKIRITCTCGCYWQCIDRKVSKVEILVHKLGHVVTGDHTYEEKVALWDHLCNTETCGVCGGIVVPGPSGGLSFNVICKNCDIVYWLTTVRSTGAYQV